MNLLSKAFLGLFCLMFLAACGAPAAPAPTPTETATLAPTNTPVPTETPRPSETPPLTELPIDAGTPGAGTALPGATSAVEMPVANPTAAAPALGGAVPDKYTYLGQDIPDRTQFLPNRTVTITWTIKNTGTVGWTKDYTLRHFAGPQPAKTVYTFTKDVPVNDTINFVVTFTTPSEPGDYDLWFKLTNSAGQNFGDLDLFFTVSNNPVKATSTPAQ